MFDPNYIMLYDRKQLEEIREQCEHRIAALKAHVLAGKPRFDDLQKVRAELKIVVEELDNRLPS